MRIVWTRLADRDLDAIEDYISGDDPAAAIRTVLKIARNVGDLLAEHQGLGRPGRVAGTRELVVPGTPFLVAYRVRAAEVQILRVLHGARRWPEDL